MRMRATVLVVVLTIASCSTTTTSTTEPPTADAPPIASTTVLTAHSAPASRPIEVTTLTIIETDPDLPYRLDVSIPQIVNHPVPAVEEAINADMRVSVIDEIERFIQWSSQIEGESVPSTFDTRYEVTLLTSDLLSVRMDITEYSAGAAHPTTFVSAHIFDLGSGQRILLGDLVAPESARPALANLVAQLVANQIYEGSAYEVFEWVGGQNELINAAHVWIGNENLGFSFDQYAVGPGVVGPVTVDLPFSAVAHLLDPNGALGTHPAVEQALAEVPSSILSIRRDGLGFVRFGDAADDVAVILEAVLGPPEFDSDWSDQSCLSGLVRTLRWPGLHILLTEGPTMWSDTGPHLVFYVYFLPEGGDPLALSTPEGLRIGSTPDELQTAYGSKVDLQDTEFGPVFMVADPDRPGGYRIEGPRVIPDEGLRPFWGRLSGEDLGPGSVVVSFHSGTDVCDIGPAA